MRLAVLILVAAVVEACHGGSQPTAPDAPVVDGGSAADDTICGNGIVGPHEACDDGNLRSHDGCSSRCTVEAIRWGSLDDGAVVGAGYGLVYDSARGRVVLVGGASARSDEPLATWEWDGVQWRRRTLAPTPALTPVQRRDAALTYDETRHRIVMFGGAAFGGLVGDTWEWDGTTWHATAPATSPAARTGATLAFDEVRGRSVLFGGRTATGVAADTWEWDGATWTAVATAHAPTPREAGAMVYDAVRRTTVLFGGSTTDAATWLYDGADWRIATTAATQPAARTQHAMVFDRGRGIVTMTGGTSDETAEWNGTDWAVHVGETPFGFDRDRASDRAAAYEPHLARVVQFRASEIDPEARRTLGVVWRWDGAAWLRSGAELAPINDTGATFGSVAGFAARLDSVTSDLWVWDGRAFQIGPATTQPSPRLLASLAGTSEATLLFGGAGPGFSSMFGDLWRYTLADGWTQLVADGSGPPARQGAGFVATAGETALLFGGRDASGMMLGDTYVWDGHAFVAHVPAAPQPQPRVYMGMAYDAGRDRVVLVGGYGWGLFGVDAWEWDGTEWAQVAAPPIYQSEPGLVYDSARGRIVLVADRLYDWDGATWTDRGYATAIPGGNVQSAVYDAARDRIVVSSYDATMFEWDGATWVTRTPPRTAPEARRGASMTSDPAHERLLLYGGARGASMDGGPPMPGARMFGDVWAWDRAGWHQLADTPTPVGPGFPKAPCPDPMDPMCMPCPMCGGPDGGLPIDATAPTPQPRARSFACAVVDASTNDLLVTEGLVDSDSGSPDGETDKTLWTWNATDGWRARDALPEVATIGPACAFDAAAGHAIVATGYVPGSLLAGVTNQLTTWDGAWHVLEAPNLLAPRVYGALAYDPIRHASVLFGGQTKLDSLSPTVLGDTLEWNGAAWSAHPATATGPAPRAHHVLAWDARLARVVLFGGVAQDGTALTDTWAWDPASSVWTRIAANSPSAPASPISAAMASDPARGGLVLFGGSSTAVELDGQAAAETWFLRADDPAVPDEGCVAGVDGDGDGLVGCDDPDCGC